MPLDNNPSHDPELTPAEKQVKGFSQQYAMAMELPLVLVGTILVGGFLGFFMDRWLHTKPIFMIVLGILGFAAGLREVLRRLPTT
jgi:ATP synthase protein I